MRKGITRLCVAASSFLMMTSLARAEMLMLNCASSRGGPPTSVEVDTSAQTANVFGNTAHADITPSSIAFVWVTPGGTSYSFNIDRLSGHMQEFVIQHAKMLDNLSFQCQKLAAPAF